MNLIELEKLASWVDERYSKEYAKLCEQDMSDEEFEKQLKALYDRTD